jgi:serine/threonine protein phosphatase 1
MHIQRAAILNTDDEPMRLLAIGDIHGCYDALRTLVDFVPISADDMVVTLGDYVDRGPDSKQVIEWVMERTGRGQCIPLRGNHEVMMLDALRGQIPMQHWLQFGGDMAIHSYAHAQGRGRVEDIPIEHLRFLDRELLPCYETAQQIFVHATLAAQRDPADQPPLNLYWERFENMEPHKSGKTVICGHTAQKDGKPKNVGYAICIDTWVYGKGWLTCLDVATGEYWQSNQRRETRRGRLDPASSAFGT